MARAKCFIFFGQKRSGKSSVLYHLQRELEDSSNFLCVNFSLGKVISAILEKEPKHVMPYFYYYIAEKLEGRLVELGRDGAPVPIFNKPTLEELIKFDIIRFEEAIQEFHTQCARVEGWSKRRLLLMLDEFTYLYKPMKEGRIGRNFLQAWKSMIEDDLFSAVIVGQDVMRKFMSDYPNEARLVEGSPT